MTDSIAIPYWFYLSLIQVAVILAVLTMVFFFKNKTVKKQLIKLTETNQTPPPVSESEDEGETEEDKTSLLQTRIESLEKFRAKYFDTKEQYASLLAIYSELEEKIKDELSSEDQEKLQKILDQLSTKKSQLEAQLKSIEIELDQIANDPGFNSSIPASFDMSDLTGSSKKIDNNLTTIKSVIEVQKTTISELNEKLSQFSADSEEKAALQESLDSLESQLKETSDAIEVLLNENEFLQAQIQALLKLEPDPPSGEDTQELKDKLVEKEKAYDELYKKFTQIEAEYIKLEEEQSKPNDH